MRIAFRAFPRIHFYPAVLLALAPTTVLAGMPSVRFHDLARPRLEVISFFLFALLLSAAVVFGLWNWLRRDITWLPRLSYGRACGVVTLWGLLFVVVLTMISGARELMTPGAWERDGWTYALANDRGDSPAVEVDHGRENHLAELSEVLLSFSDANEGRFPNEREIQNVAGANLALPDQSGLHYVYISGRVRDDQPRLLAYEPAVAGDDPLALFTNGEVRRVTFDSIRLLRASGMP